MDSGRGGFFYRRPLSVAQHARNVRPRLDPNFEQIADELPSGGIMTNMARRARGMRRFTRRTRGRRRGTRRRLRHIALTWPRFRLVKFKVVTQVSPSSTGGTGAINQYAIQANSLSDPHATAGTNLPLGLDQWAAMYGKYCVVSSTHYVRFHNLTSTGSVIFGMTLRAPGESSLLTNAEQYLELPMTRSKVLSPDLDHSGLGITYRAKRYWQVRKFMDHEDLHATFSTTPGNPAKTAHVSIWFEDVSRTQDFTLEGYLTSEYTVLLFEPVRPSRSSV